MSAEDYMPNITMDDVNEYAMSDEASETAIEKYEPQAVATTDEHTDLMTTPYAGVAAQPFADKAQAVLAAHEIVPDEWLEIKPNGQIYLSHMRLRKILNEAFGFGGWGLVPVADSGAIKTNGNQVTVFREYRFYAEGRFVRQVMASGDYWKNNSDMDQSDAVEMCESYALNRVGKFFGIASQCWSKEYTEAWKRDFAEQTKNDRGKLVWRKRGGSSPPPQASPEPPPQTTVTATPGTLTVADVHKGTSGKNKQGAWQLYLISLSDGKRYATFSTTDYETAIYARENGIPVRITSEDTEKGKNLISIELIEGPEDHDD